MIIALISILSAIYLIIFLVGMMENSLPTYKRNRKSFRNFTYFDFILFATYLPFELIYIFFTNPTLGLLQFLKKRPFRKLTFNVGDKVIYANKVCIVTEAVINSDMEERFLLEGHRYYFSPKELKKISPLEEVI